MVEKAYSSNKYSNISSIDPSKKYVQYPSSLALLGNIRDKVILDIGCGDGILTRQIALKGAQVYGYDNAKKQIEIAQKEEVKLRQGIKYYVSNPVDFKINLKADKVIATLVLPAAQNLQELENFFKSASNYLGVGGVFISINLNPDFKPSKTIAYNRRFTKLPDEKIKIEFFENNQKFKFSILDSDFSFKEYEAAAKRAGFKKVQWKKLKISEEGIQALGKNFWEGYEDNCPYIGLCANK